MDDAAAAGSFARAFPLEPDGAGRFRCRLDGFGGTTLGCATLAAGRSQPDLALHSLHACFVRPVPTEGPCLLQIEPISQGRRFARQRAWIEGDGRLCFELVASFAAPLDGPELPGDEPLPALPAPEDLPSDREVARAEGWDWEDDPDHPLELRWCGRPWEVGAGESSRYSAWVRPCVIPATGPERAAGIAFLADFHSHWPVARRLGGSFFEPEGFTSLDQTVWIHRDGPWDDWWLLTSWAAAAHAGRSLGHRTLHDRDGRLVASMAQEALIPGARPRA